MKWFICVTLAVAGFFILGGSSRADDQDPSALIDKAIKALGGEAALGKAGAIAWKAKGKITRNGNENEFTSQVTVQGLDQYRSEFEGTFNGNNVKGVTVVNGAKGWRKFGDMSMEMNPDVLANEKRNIYLQVIPATLVALKGKGFKVESAGEEKIGDKPAAGIKGTGPEGKEFKLYFDKETGLPVRLSARVVGFRQEEFFQEVTFSNYQVMGGLKKATKIESKRDGELFLVQEIQDFKVLDNVPPDTFAEPR